MKKLLLSTLFAATLSFNAFAALKTTNNFKFVGDTEYAELCKAAATNDLNLFKNKVRQHGFQLNVTRSKMLSLLANGDSFQCSGQNLVSFSQSRGSQDVANYLTGAKEDLESASSSKYKFVGDREFKNFCKSAVTNNVALFKRALASQVGNLGLSRHEVMDKVLEADNVKCAGESLREFFQSREATKVMSYIADKSAK